MNIYNTQPLLNEIEIVIKNGLDKMLSKILQRYNLLEKTHNQLMNLPSIKEAIGKDYDDQDVESESESEIESLNPEIDNIVSCQTTMKLDVLNIESKLDKLEKKYAGLYPMLDKILDKIETLNNDVQKMKSSHITAATTVATISSSVEPTIVTACENENITFEIKEKDNESVDEEDVEVEDEDVEDEDVEVEENVEEKEVLKDVVVESVDEEVQENVEEEDVVAESVEVLKDVVAESAEEEENDDSKSVETETKSDTESVEDEEDLEVITIDDIDYCTNNEENGFIWELTEDGEQGTKVGYLKDGEPFFYAEEN